MVVTGREREREERKRGLVGSRRIHWGFDCELIVCPCATLLSAIRICNHKKPKLISVPVTPVTHVTRETEHLLVTFGADPLCRPCAHHLKSTITHLNPSSPSFPQSTISLKMTTMNRYVSLSRLFYSLMQLLQGASRYHKNKKKQQAPKQAIKEASKKARREKAGLSTCVPMTFTDRFCVVAQSSEQ